MIQDFWQFLYVNSYRIFGRTEVRTHFKYTALLATKLCMLNPYKIVSEYDQEIPQSQTADNPMVPRGSAAQPSRDNRKTN